MSEFGVSPSKLVSQIHDFDAMQSLLESYKSSVDSIASGISFSSVSSDSIRNRLRSVSGRLDNADRNMRSMKEALGDISSAYSRTEQKIIEQAVLPKVTASGSTLNAEAHAGVSVEDGRANASAGASASVAEGAFTKESKYGTISGEGKILSAEASAEAEYHMTENEIGASAKADAGASVAEGTLSANSKYASGAISGSIAAVGASAAGTASLGYHDGKLYGELSGKADVHGSVAHGEAEGKIGTENLNMHGSAEGSLVGAGASAEAGVEVNENGSVEVEVKAEAEAYLAKGEVSGGFDIFGLKIGVEVEGMIGVQAEAGGKISSSGVELDGGLGPIGGKISIDWSEFNPPNFYEIIDWIF